MSNSETFSQRFSRTRRLLGLSQEEFAQQMGMSRNYVSMIEGGREPSDSVMKLFQAKYGDLEKSSRMGVKPCQKLKVARVRLGLSVAEAAKRIGYSDTSMYQAIEEGRSQMGRKMAERASKLYGIPLEELLDGSDHPPENGTLTGTFGTQPEIEMGPGMEGSRAKFVPLLSMAQCGSMMAYDDTGYAHEGFIAFDTKDPKAFSVRLAGDSMAPRYEQGDVAVIYPQSPPRNGGVVIARLNDDAGGDVMFKIYHAAGDAITLTSYNPAYPPLTFRRPDFRWIYPVAAVTRVLL